MAARKMSELLPAMARCIVAASLMSCAAVCKLAAPACIAAMAWA
jgi:hypothetical protein